MARGFESKDVEFQQAEADRTTPKRRALSPGEREAKTRRRSIELALLKVRAERAAAANPDHRRMLDAAIEALEEQLRARPVFETPQPE